jgi:predicted metal-dependent peptidase
MSDIDKQEVINKLTSARTKLILDKPFLGALVLRLPLQEADPSWCPATGTDAKKFYYNPEFIDALKPEETQFILAHEALHCALSHFARRQHRVKHRWDLACDYAINPILVEDGLTPPPGMVMMRDYKDMTAEEIYPLIDDNDMTETLDQHLYDKEDNPAEGSQDSSDNPLDEKPQDDSGKGQGQGDSQESNGNSGGQEFDEQAGSGNEAPPPPLTQQEAEELSVQWQQRMAGAAQQAMQAGKMSGVMKRLVEELLQPRLPWRMLLARYMTAVARDDYSYTRPSTRRGNPAIFPSLKSSQINVVVALDVSGSVSDKELNDCLSEINAIKGQMRAKVTLLACDAEIIEDFPRVFEAWEEVTLPETIKGGGTTDFRPVFTWAEQQDQQPDILVYFTDAMGYFPQFSPNYPTIWLIKGKGNVPFGQRIQLN